MVSIELFLVLAIAVFCLAVGFFYLLKEFLSLKHVVSDMAFYFLYIFYGGNKINES